MALFLIPLLLLSTLNWSPLGLLKTPIQLAQELCLSLTQDRGSHLYQALICAYRASEESTFYIWAAQIGLAHWFVISGLHLNFIENFLAQFQKHKVLIGIVLMIYACFTGLNPPILRAFISLMLMWLQTSFKWGWKPHLHVLTTGFICLALDFNLYNSLSLQLSWAAALSLGWTSKKNLKHVTVYLFLIPFLSVLNPAHPFSIILNILFTPFFCFIFFPLTLISFVFPWSELFYLPLVQLMEAFVEQTANLMPSFSWTFPLLKTQSLWLILILTHAFLAFKYLGLKVFARKG